MILEVRRDDVAVGVVRGVLHGAEILHVHVVRHDHQTAGVLARGAAHAHAALHEPVDLRRADDAVVFFQILLDKAVGGLFRQRTDGARAEHLRLAEHLDGVAVGAGLVLAGEVEVDIRHLAAAVAQKGLKRDIKPVLDVLLPAFRTDLVRHIRAAAVAAVLDKLHVPALRAAVVRRERVDLRDAGHIRHQRRADAPSGADEIPVFERALHQLLRAHVHHVVLAEDAPQLHVQSVGDELRQLLAVERVRLLPHHAVEVFLGVFEPRREQLALGQQLDRLHHVRDHARVGHNHLIRLVLAEIVELAQHFVRGAEVDGQRRVGVGKLLAREQDMAVLLVLRLLKMHVAGGADGLAQLLAQADDGAVVVLQFLVVLRLALADQEAVVAQRLDLEIVVERRDALELVPVLMVAHGLEQLPRLAGGADDQPFAVRDQLAFGDGGIALEIFEIRRGNELIEVFESRFVPRDQNDVLGIAVGAVALRAQLAHFIVDLLDARHAARFEHREELCEHLRHRHRVVARAVVVERGQLQLLRHHVQLVVFEPRQQILREDQRVEIRRLERDAARFAARADEADIELRVVRGENAPAREVKERAQRILQLRRAGEHRVGDAGQPHDLRRQASLRVDKGLERVHDLPVAQQHRANLGDRLLRHL